MPLSLQQSFSQAAAQQQQQRLQHSLSQYQRKALELLQKPGLEMRAEVQQKLLQNPILMEVPHEVPTLDDLPQDNRRRQRDVDDWDADGRQYKEDWLRDVVENQSAFDGERRMDGRKPLTDPEEAKRRDYSFNVLTQSSTLYGQMVAAIRGDVEGSQQFKAVCEVLAGQMDAAGYITDSDEELAAIAQCDVDTAARARAAIQALDPPGLGARDLRECLLLQLERRGRRDSLEWRVVDGFLNELAKGAYGAIADALDCEEYEVEDAQAEIKETLDPHPGWQVCAPQSAPTVVVDVIVERAADGIWSVRCNHGLVPQVMCNPEYLELAKKPGLSQADQKWFDEKIGEAEQLIKHLDYRENTLERMTWLLLERQPRVFESGKLTELEPMTQAECAEALGVNTSTVCRLVNDKYLSAPWLGVKELKAFFTTGFRADDGREISSLKVSQRLREIFDGEDHSRPLSDDDVAAMMGREGLKISRRTVTKYRLRENIPSSFERRTK